MNISVPYFFPSPNWTHRSPLLPCPEANGQPRSVECQADTRWDGSLWAFPGSQCHMEAPLPSHLHCFRRLRCIPTNSHLRLLHSSPSNNEKEPKQYRRCNEIHIGAISSVCLWQPGGMGYRELGLLDLGNTSPWRVWIKIEKALAYHNRIKSSDRTISRPCKS